MDIEIGGIKLSKFISSFKQMYRLTDTTYDYMSYLEIADCASYCALNKQYDNPNDILNSLITPYLNSINVTSQKIEDIQNDMKGGQGGSIGMFLIIILFTLMLGNVYGGTATDSFYESYGKDATRWPKNPGDQPSKPPVRYIMFFWAVEPTTDEITDYARRYGKWEDQHDKYKTFIQEYNSMQVEQGHERRIEDISAQTYKTYADATKIEKQTEQYKTIAYSMIGMTLALGSLGLIGVIVSYAMNKKYVKRSDAEEAVRIAFGLGFNQGARTLGDGNIQGRPEIGYGGSTSLIRRRGGRKTKNYKKKRTTTKRRR